MVFSFTTIDGGWVPQAEIDTARRTLSKDIFEQEFLSFQNKVEGKTFRDLDKR